MRGLGFGLWALGLGLIGACGGSAKPVAKPIQKVEGKPTAALMGEKPLLCPSKIDAAVIEYQAGYDAAAAGDFELAEEHYKKAIELDSQYCDAMDNLALIYRRSGRNDEAIALYRQSIAVKPDNELALQNLGVAYQAAGRFDDAIDAYRQLTRVNSRNPEGYFGLAITYFKLGRWDEAITQALAARDLYHAEQSEYEKDARYLAGFAAAKLGKWDLVRSELEAIYGEYGGDPWLNLYLGMAYLQPPRDATRARQYLDRAKELGAPIPADVQADADRG